MYCPRCRIEVGENTFCENCGGNTIESQKVASAPSTVQSNIPYPVQEEIKKKKVKIQTLKFTVKKIVSITVILAMVIGGLIGYNTLKEQYTPRKTVEKYYDYLIKKDYKSAYKMLVDNDTNFLSEDMFKSSMEKLDFSQYTIKNFSPGEYKQIYYDPQNASNFNINNAGNMFSVQAGGRTYPVSVVDTGKKLLFFKDYKLSADTLTVKWQFTAPIGAKISIKGKEPAKSNEPNMDSSLGLNSVYKPISAVYEIGHIFYGNYDVTATMEGAKEVNYKDVEAGIKINIKFEPTPELVKQLQDKVKSFLDLYYANSSQDKYSNLLTTDSNALSKTSIYMNDKIVNKVKDIKVTKQSIDDFEHATLSIKCIVDYEDSSWALWGGQVLKGTKDLITEFYFVKQNGKWLIADTGYIN